MVSGTAYSILLFAVVITIGLWLGKLSFKGISASSDMNCGQTKATEHSLIKLVYAVFSSVTASKRSRELTANFFSCVCLTFIGLLVPTAV